MAYELTGKIKLLQETQTFGSGFQKREIVVTVEEGNIHKISVWSLFRIKLIYSIVYQLVRKLR